MVITNAKYIKNVGTEDNCTVKATIDDSRK